MFLEGGVLLALFVTLCLTLLLYSVCYEPYQYFKRRNIAGPTPWPVIGNLPSFTKHQGRLHVYLHELVKTYGPTCGVYVGFRHVHIVSDPEKLKKIMIKYFDKFTDRFVNVGINPISYEGEKQRIIGQALGESWRVRRHILSPAFSAHKMKLMESLMKESIDRLGKKLNDFADKRETVELLNLFNHMTMEVILSNAFGRFIEVQNGRGGKLYEAATHAFGALANDGEYIIKLLQMILLSFPSLAKVCDPILNRTKLGQSFKYLIKMSEEAIKQRRELIGNVERKDLLQLLIEAQDEKSNKRLTNGEVIADVVGFLLAGYETTSTALTFTTYLLALHPEVQERVYDEIIQYFDENPDKSFYNATHELEYLDMVLNESLRIYPPVPLNFRYCTDDCSIEELNFKKGDSIFIPTYTLHMDEKVWDEPEKFKPERFTAEEKAHRHSCSYMPFGAGPRNCIGMRFALMEAKMTLIEVFKNYKVTLSPKTKVPLETDLAFTLRPLNGVYVTFQRRL